MSEGMKTVNCPSCGAENPADAQYCASCGKPLTQEAAAPADPATVENPMGQLGAIPKTISELQAWTAARRMPLEKMRFFIGTDYREPRAFGIWEDQPGHFTVYKNKADGSSAVRYSGPDEAYAVNEIFLKLLSECHNRGIHPERIGENGTGSTAEAEKMQRASSSLSSAVSGIVTSIIIAMLVLWMLFQNVFSHSRDGYYRRNNGDVYYRHGSSCYTYSTRVDDWVESWGYDSDDDVFLGSLYSSGFGVSDFKSSDAWDDLNDSDYDSWDSGDTDWDSDW